MKRIVREYNMADSDLMVFSNSLITFLTRDATEFAVRGVDSAAVTAYEALVTAFTAFPPDEFYRADVKETVDAKNNYRALCMDNIQLISGFFEQQWGVKDWHYDKLRIKGIENKKDNEFLVSCTNVAATAELYLTELSAIGLIQDMIDELVSHTAAMRLELRNIEEKKDVRDRKAYERIKKGNELYGYVKQYCTIGKLIWENLDESKYNDYLIYPAVEHGLGKVRNVTAVYTATPAPTIVMSWNAVEGATKYALYQSIVAIGDPPGEYIFINDFTGTGETLNVMPDARYWFYLQAKNDTETGTRSNELFCDTVEE